MAVALLMVGIAPAHAEWSGVSVSISEVDSDWIFENDRRKSVTSRLDLQFEEKTSSGLGVGVNIGQLSTLVSNLSGPLNSMKFDGSYVGVYLRYPVSIGEIFSIQSKFAYQYHSASQIDSSVNNQIEIRETSVELGLSGKFGNFRITPFARYSNVGGDISGDSGTEIFENEDAVSSGISFDLFVEPTGFIRLRLTSGDQDSAALSFAREF